jgi:peptide/nickel transport system substrate-binding protein
LTLFKEVQNWLGPFARKIQLAVSIARDSDWPVFWPRSRFSDGQLRLSHPMRSLFIGTVLIGVAACGGNPQKSVGSSPLGVVKGGDLTVSVRTEPRSFCRCINPDATTYLVTLLTQARLVRENQATGDLEPWLAESWTRSDDGLRYVVKLRPNVQFSDGAPLTADDVVFSFAAAYDPASAVADSLYVLGKKLQATAVDPLTVSIEFPGSFGPGLHVLDDVAILPKHKLEGAFASGRFASAWGLTTPLQDIVGLGPFVLADYRPGERMVFERNRHYFRADDHGAQLPYLDRIIVEIVPDQDAQLLKLQAGESDAEASEVRPEDYAPLKQAAGQGSLQLMDLGVATDPDGLWFNLRPNAFDRDPRRAWLQRDELRAAISDAVDRQLFADTVFLGAAAPVFGPITPSNKRWYSGEVPRPTHDMSRARQLLSQIGLIDRHNDGVVEDATGTPARFTLLTAKGQTALERGAKVISDELRKLGLGVDVVSLEGNALIQKVVSGEGYDAVYFHLTSTSTDPALNPDFWLTKGAAHVWNPGQKTPATEWERQIDELMAQNASALDDSARKTAFVEAQKIFASHQPMVYFAAPHVFVAASTRMMNLTPALSRPQLLWAADTIAVRH